MHQRENRRVHARKFRNEITHPRNACLAGEVSLKGSPFAMLRDASPTSSLFIYRSVVSTVADETVKFTAMLTVAVSTGKALPRPVGNQTSRSLQ